MTAAQVRKGGRFASERQQQSKTSHIDWRLATPNLCTYVLSGSAWDPFSVLSPRSPPSYHTVSVRPPTKGVKLEGAGGLWSSGVGRARAIFAPPRSAADPTFTPPPRFFAPSDGRMEGSPAGPYQQTRPAPVPRPRTAAARSEVSAAAAAPVTYPTAAAQYRPTASSDVTTIHLPTSYEGPPLPSLHHGSPYAHPHNSTARLAAAPPAAMYGHSAFRPPTSSSQTAVAGGGLIASPAAHTAAAGSAPQFHERRPVVVPLTSPVSSSSYPRPLHAAPPAPGATTPAVSMGSPNVQERLMDTAMRLRDSDRSRLVLETRVMASAHELQQRDREFEALSEEVKLLRAERDELRYRSQHLDEREAAAHGDNLNAQREADQLRQQLVQVTSELSKSDELSKQRATDLASVSIAKAKLERQLGKAQTEINGTVAASMSTLEVAEQRQAEAVRRQKEATEAMQATERELAHATARLQATSSELYTIREDHDALQRQHVDDTTTIQQLRVTVHDLEIKLQNCMEERTAKMQQVLSDTDRQISSLSAALAERTSSHSQSVADKNDVIDTLSAQVNDLRAQLAIVAPTLAQQEDRLRDLTEIDIPQRDSTIVELRNSLEVYRHDVQELRTQLVTLEADKRAVDSQLAKSMRQCTERDAHVAELQAILSQLRTELASTTDRAAQLEASVDTMRRDADSRRAEVMQIREEADHMRLRNQELSAIAHDETLAREQAVGRVDRIQTQLDKALWEAKQAQEAAAAREVALREEMQYIVSSHQSESEQGTIRAKNREELTEERHRAQVAAYESKLASADERIAALQRRVDELQIESAKEAVREKSQTEGIIDKRLAVTDQRHRQEVEELNRQLHVRIEENRAEAMRRYDALKLSHTSEKATIEMDRSRERDSHVRVQEDLKDRVARAESQIEDLRQKLRAAEAASIQRDDAHRVDVQKIMEDGRRREMELQAELSKLEQAASERAYADRENQRRAQLDVQATMREEESKLLDRLHQERDAAQRLSLRCSFFETALARESKGRSTTLQEHETVVRRLVVGLAESGFQVIAAEMLRERLFASQCGLRDALDWSQNLLHNDESRARQLIEIVSSVGADAINIMTAYRVLREESRLTNLSASQSAAHMQDAQRQLLQSKDDLESRLRGLEGEVQQESRRRERLARDNEELETMVQRSVERERRLEEEKHVLKERMEAAMALPLTRDGATSVTTDAAPRSVSGTTDSSMHRDDLVRALWGVYTLTVITRRHMQIAFQHPGWLAAVQRGDISDEAGDAFCRIVEDVHRLFDETYRCVCVFLSDDEKLALGASVEAFRTAAQPHPPYHHALAAPDFSDLPQPRETVQVRHAALPATPTSSHATSQEPRRASALPPRGGATANVSVSLGTTALFDAEEVETWGIGIVPPPVPPPLAALSPARGHTGLVALAPGGPISPRTGGGPSSAQAGRYRTVTTPSTPPPSYPPAGNASYASPRR